MTDRNIPTPDLPLPDADARARRDERLMRLAMGQADRAAELGEVPIGAVVICDGEVVAAAHNRRELDRDPSAHAEFLAMLEAARALGRWRLTGCTVYVTCEPCLMCAGLMVNARIDRCVYGAPDPKGGALGTLYDVSHDARLNHEFEVTPGVLGQECADQLRTFFSALRARRRRERTAAGSPRGGATPASPATSDAPAGPGGTSSTGL
jgi:tRNA(adenine34) deaminase